MTAEIAIRAAELPEPFHGDPMGPDHRSDRPGRELCAHYARRSNPLSEPLQGDLVDLPQPAAHFGTDQVEEEDQVQQPLHQAGRLMLAGEIHRS